MIAPPGSTLWLLRHEMRLAFRGLLARRARGRVGTLWLTAGLPLVLLATAGLPMGYWLRTVEVPVAPLSILAVLVVAAMIFTLMLSQTLASAVEALYQRGDLDLLFSSPIAPRKVLTVRFFGLAATVFAVFAFFVTPVLIPIALMGHPGWLGALAVLASLALAASGAGLLLAAGLFGLIGPRRTRTVAQILAALIGAGFFLVAQAHNILGGARAESLGQVILRLGADPRFSLPPGADWPLRAALGEPLPLIGVVAVGAGVFLAANAWLGERFARDAAAAAGAGAGRTRTRAEARPFAAGVFAATLRKELRLLFRDPALLSQVLMRVLYLLPLGFVILRQAGSHQAVLLPGSAAALSLMAGQVAGSLAWITVSAEDAPDLLACAPAGVATVRRAKLAAAILPVAVLLAPVLAPLLVLSPVAGLAAAVGCGAAIAAASLLNVWWQRPAKRSEFRSRRSASWFVTLAELLVGLLIAAATGLAAAAQVWALIPAVLAGLLLLGMRRSDARIADALRATA